MDFIPGNTKKPTFRIEYDGAGFRATGDVSVIQGHKIPLEEGKRDDGIFVEWHWDGEVLTVRNDRYGIYPLFYAGDNKKIAISTSIFGVLNADNERKLDFDALAVFFRTGYMIGNDTPFKNIRSTEFGFEVGPGAIRDIANSSRRVLPKYAIRVISGCD